MNDLLQTLYIDLCLIPASFPIAIHYRMLPSTAFKRLQQIVATESEYSYDICNVDGSHCGVFQIGKSDSTMGQKWKSLPAILSIPLQTLDVTLLHLSKPGGEGEDKLIIQHHGLIKWSDYKRGVTDPYIDVVKGKPYIPLPVEGLLLVPALLLL